MPPPIDARLLSPTGGASGARADAGRGLAFRYFANADFSGRPVEAGTETDFTDREREVTELVAIGLTNAEIGRRIFVSESTAKFHVRNVMRKLGVHSRAEVAYAAGKRGLLDEQTSR